MSGDHFSETFKITTNKYGIFISFGVKNVGIIGVRTGKAKPLNLCVFIRSVKRFLHPS